MSYIQNVSHCVYYSIVTTALLAVIFCLHFYALFRIFYVFQGILTLLHNNILQVLLRGEKLVYYDFAIRATINHPITHCAYVPYDY